MKNNRSPFLITALGGLALVAGLALLVKPDPGNRNFEIFTEMAYSQAAESYSPSAFFADGRTIQPLVAGVVPRGGLPFPYGAGPDESRRAGAELKNPIAPDDPAIAALGAELFRIGCVVCHDARGNGKGLAAMRGMLTPPSFHAARATQIADGEIFHILTRGQGNMASYAAHFSERERWLLVSYIRKLQKEGP